MVRDRFDMLIKRKLTYVCATLILIYLLCLISIGADLNVVVSFSSVLIIVLYSFFNIIFNGFIIFISLGNQKFFFYSCQDILIYLK